jgi:hypothetical protein
MNRNTSAADRPANPAPAVGGLVPASLVALSAIPLTAGLLRLVQLVGGTAMMPADLGDQPRRRRTGDPPRHSPPSPAIVTPAAPAHTVHRLHP